MYDDIDGRPEILDGETLKKMAQRARDRARKAVAELPSEAVLGFLDGEYFTQELVDALNAIMAASDHAQRLYTIAEAKQARDRATEIITSKTALIAALEVGRGE